MRYVGLIFSILFSLGVIFGNEIPLVQQTGNQQNPKAIFIPEYRLYFVVWEDWRDTTDADIYGAFFKEDGTACGSEILLAGTTNDTDNQTYPDVAYAKDLKKLIVVWQDTRGGTTGGYIYYKEIDLSGVSIPVDCANINNQIVQGAENQVGFNALSTEQLSSRFKPKVAYNLTAKQFVITWIEKRSDNKTLTDICFNGHTFTYRVGDNTFVGYLILNANNLSIAEGPDILRNSPNHARLIQESQGALTWTFEYEHFENVDNVDVACEETSNSCLIVFEGDRNRTVVTCECDDTNNNGICDGTEPVSSYATTDNFQGDDDKKHIFATTLEQFKLSTGLLTKIDSSSEDSTVPAVEADPITKRFLVVWEDRRDDISKTKIYGQLVSSSGSLYGNNFIISYEDLDGDGSNDSALLNSSQSFPNVVYDSIHQRYLVIWQDDRNNIGSNLNIDIYGQFVDLEGSLRGNNVQLVQNAVGNQLTPSQAYNPYTGELFIVWKDSRNTDSDLYALITVPQTTDVYENLKLYSQDGQTPLFPAILDFGGVAVNDEFILSFYIKNEGNVEIPIDCITLSGSGFSIVSPIPQQLNACGENSLYSLLPGESIKIDISFKPSQNIFYEGYLNIQNPQIGLNLAVRLKGKGIDNPLPDITIIEGDGTNDGTLDFRNVKAGTVATNFIIIRNTGNVTVTVEVVTSSSEFQPVYLPEEGVGGALGGLVRTALTLTLLPDSQAKVLIDFNAQNLYSGTYTGKLSITITNATGKFTSIDLKAQVVSPASIQVKEGDGNDDGVLDFGSVKTGSTATQTIDIYNNGSVDLEVYVSTSDAKFSVSSSQFTLKPGENRQITVSFDATGLLEGTYSADIQISTNNANVSNKLKASVVVKAPILRINVSEVDFGEVQVGNSKDISVEIYNEGDVNMSIDSCGNPFNGFSVIQCPQSVAPKSSATIVYRFHPQKPGNYSVDITIKTDGGEKNITLKGKGLGGWIEVQPEILDFGYVAVGTTKKLNFTVTNTGTEKITIDSIDTTNLPAPFSVNSLINLPIELGPSQSFTFTVEFSPNLEKSYVGSIQINTNAVNGNPKLYIQGIAASANVIVSPTNLDFGNITVGTEIAKVVTITNNGNLPVKILDISKPSEQFTVEYSFSLPYELKAGESVNLVVKFTPQEAGSFSSVLSILFDYSSSPQAIVLSGSANDSGQVNPSTLRILRDGVDAKFINFGEVLVNTSHTVSIELRNESPTPVEIVEIKTIAPFYVYNENIKINANSSEFLNVYFKPSLSIRYTGKLTLKDSNGNTYEITLSGTGVNVLVSSADGRTAVKEETILPPSKDYVPILSFSFEVSDLQKSQAQINIQLSKDLPDGVKIYKYLGNNLYKEIYPTNECNGISNINLNGNTLSLLITDNSECDLSPEQGVILDPIVIVSSWSSATAESPSYSVPSIDGGGSGGCSISRTSDLSILSYLITFVLIVLRRLRFLK